MTNAVRAIAALLLSTLTALAEPIDRHEVFVTIGPGATAALPSKVMKSRRLMGRPSLRATAWQLNSSISDPSH
jgi:hypothetical protein